MYYWPIYYWLQEKYDIFDRNDINLLLPGEKELKIIEVMMYRVNRKYYIYDFSYN